MLESWNTCGSDICALEHIREVEYVDALNIKAIFFEVATDCSGS
jgi:hypothetical protein